jgi:phosphoketolase
VLGEFLRRVVRLNREARNFRIFGPDETLSNRLNAVFEDTNRQWEARTKDNDEFLATEGNTFSDNDLGKGSTFTVLLPIVGEGVCVSAS